jgi:hypothetical protein
MKKPREILLARHQAAAPKLDAIRQSAVAAVCDRRISTDCVRERRSQTAATMIWRIIWRELIFPCRRTWAGLAAVWMALLIFNVSQRDKAELAARKLPPPSPEAIMAWRQQERLLAELIGPSAPGDAEHRKIFLPKPRTENAATVAV